MTSVNDLPAKWRSEINGCAIDNCAHCLSLAVALNELEAALAQQAGASEQVLQLLLAGGFVDPVKVDQARAIIASSGPGGGGEGGNG